ncbi:hypothetical protein V7S43_013414 [Phytophthora oleae]|uniref:Uncharacterized protein n=1 Tax=Phytophthora oleae TaxID=2107226 RepID=A0ABD3F6L3_9STRA
MPEVMLDGIWKFWMRQEWVQGRCGKKCCSPRSVNYFAKPVFTKVTELNGSLNWKHAARLYYWKSDGKFH